MNSFILYINLAFALFNSDTNSGLRLNEQLLLDEKPLSDSAELKEFKLFSVKFFTAVKNKDTIFLKKHIVFPIPTHSFSNFDKSLETVKKMDSNTFWKKLSRLFPPDLINKTNDAEHSIFRNPNGKVEYIVTVYSDSSGVESNANWMFMKKQGGFYFVYFTAEAG